MNVVAGDDRKRSWDDPPGTPIRFSTRTVERLLINARDGVVTRCSPTVGAICPAWGREAVVIVTEKRSSRRAQCPIEQHRVPVGQ